MEEFIENGFEKASTNEIVKAATISKGSLFNYFNNKKDLFFFLFNYAIDITGKIIEEMDWSETDIFNRWREIALIKFKIIKQFPEVFNFLMAVIEEKSVVVKPEVANKVQQVAKSSYDMMYRNIDLTKFRDDIDVQKTLNIINWTLESFSQQEQQKQKALKVEQLDLEHLIKEMDSYLQLMKCCFYK